MNDTRYHTTLPDWIDLQQQDCCKVELSDGVCIYVDPALGEIEVSGVDDRRMNAGQIRRLGILLLEAAVLAECRVAPAASLADCRAALAFTMGVR
jgi:hypothetical protein